MTSTPQTNPAIKIVTFVFIGIVAAVLGALLARHALEPKRDSVSLKTGTAFPAPRPVPNFTLVDQSGKPFERSGLIGHWSFLFFGFTSCADVCPTTLATLALTSKQLQSLPTAQQPQVVFFSVDAKRDTPDVVAKYVHAFDERFMGVTGQQESLDTFTRELGVPSAIRPFPNGSYGVDHSAAILLVNAKGEVAAIFSPPHTPEGLASDYKLMIESAR